MTKDAYPSELAERFQIRLPDGLRDDIKASAEKNHRSMNAEIIFRLEDSYRAERSSDLHALLWEIKSHLEVTKPTFEAIGRQLGIIGEVAYEKEKA